jgi:hypothetical protein
MSASPASEEDDSSLETPDTGIIDRSGDETETPNLGNDTMPSKHSKDSTKMAHIIIGDSKTRTGPHAIRTSIRSFLNKPLEYCTSIYIVTASNKELEGCVKIGITRDGVERNNALGSGCNLKNVNTLLDFHYPTRNMAARVEALVHKELSNHLIDYQCLHVLKGEQVYVQHKEWFRISKDLAYRTVTRWDSFMVCKPYRDGSEDGALNDAWSKWASKQPVVQKIESKNHVDGKHELVTDARNARLDNWFALESFKVARQSTAPAEKISDLKVEAQV